MGSFPFHRCSKKSLCPESHKSTFEFVTRRILGEDDFCVLLFV